MVNARAVPDSCCKLIWHFLSPWCHFCSLWESKRVCGHFRRWNLKVASTQSPILDLAVSVDCSLVKDCNFNISFPQQHISIITIHHTFFTLQGRRSYIYLWIYPLVIISFMYWIYNLWRKRGKKSTQNNTSIPGLSICIKKRCIKHSFWKVGYIKRKQT